MRSLTARQLSEQLVKTKFTTRNLPVRSACVTERPLRSVSLNSTRPADGLAVTTKGGLSLVLVKKATAAATPATTSPNPSVHRISLFVSPVPNDLAGRDAGRNSWLFWGVQGLAGLASYPASTMTFFNPVAEMRLVS